MHSSEKERLLRETLRDADYEQYRAASFTAGIRVLRLKKRRSAPWRPLALAAMITFLLSLAFFRAQREKDISVSPDSLPPVPTSSLQIVYSVRDPQLEVETSSMGDVETVQTQFATITEVDDLELLTLLTNRPVAILRQENRTELLLLGN